MTAPIELAVLSMSARSPEGDDAAYLEWHGLDHRPEQYGITGIQHGQRWVSTPDCRAARAADDERFSATDHVMQYLFAEPLAESLNRFFALGAQLHQAGRMPLRLPAVELGGYRLVHRATAPHALVRPEVLPWRPCLGAFLLVERGGDDADGDSLCEVPGVAGFWRYRGGQFHERLADTDGLHLTVCYLDDDPVATSTRVGRALGAVRGEPLLAAPFVSVVPWAWDRALP